MSIYVDYLNGEGALQHHGVKGQKWGVRRYQPYPSGQKLGKEIGKAAKSGERSKDFFKSRKSHDPSTNLYDSSTVSSGGAAGASTDEEELETINTERIKLMAELQSVEFEPDPDPEVQADSENKRNLLRERIKELDRKRDKILEKIRNAQKESSELQHHGILGMKWGIRRYQPYPKGHAGGKEIGKAAKRKQQKANAKEFSKILKKKRSPERDEKIVQAINESGSKTLRDKVFKSRDRLREIERVTNDFWDNKELHRKYATKVAEREWNSGRAKLYGYGDIDKKTFVQLFIEGDHGNHAEGQYSALDEYFKDKGIDSREHAKKHGNAVNEYLNDVSRYTRDLLGSFGDREVKYMESHSFGTRTKDLKDYVEEQFEVIDELNGFVDEEKLK